MLDLFVLTIEDMTRHLKAINNRKLSPIELTTTGFLLTEEQRRARQGEWKKREASGLIERRAHQPRKKDKGKDPRLRGGDSSDDDGK